MHIIRASEDRKKVIVLLLGYAVQCEEKEQFIQQIKNMNLTQKEDLAGHIQGSKHTCVTV